MKKLIAFLILIVFTVGCKDTSDYEHGLFLKIVNTGSGSAGTYTYLKCDSFSMVSIDTAYVWRDGTKMMVIVGYDKTS